MEDVLTRRWNSLLDALTAYLARELTPTEETELSALIIKWNSKYEEIEI